MWRAPGLLARIVGGHWGLIPALAELEAWNLPQGVISHLFREIAAGRPGTLGRIGLHTFVDPRQDGGRIDDVSKDALVELVELAGQELLFHKSFPIDVALLRGTTADTLGNVSMEREALTLDNLTPRRTPTRSGWPSTTCRRCRSPRARSWPAARPSELPVDGVVDLGIGMPEGVASVAAEEGVLDRVTLTAEPGVIGGIPTSGLDFGAAVNPDASIDQTQQFDFYDGGGLDMACLGMAELDRLGNVNVSRFGTNLAGAGGFFNVSQSARTVVFTGTFTAGGLDVAVGDGRLTIRSEGRSRKLREAVQQVTFNGRYAAAGGQRVLHVTERAVFGASERGLRLTEVAPGIDVERDVLAHMDFQPLCDGEPARMDPRLSTDGSMGLSTDLGL